MVFQNVQFTTSFFFIPPEIAEYFNLVQFPSCMQYNICFAEVPANN